MRLWLPLLAAKLPDETHDPSARPPNLRDPDALADLMYHAYRGTIDDAGETPEDARAEVRKFFANGYGPFLIDQSELIVRDERPVAATLITIWEGLPLLAMSMTHPDSQRRGLARAGLARALHRLRRAGYAEIHLAVTRGNPAEGLYRAFGFRDFAPEPRPG
jgi:GNAT superfamily N-acetyltransferase